MIPTGGHAVWYANLSIRSPQGTKSISTGAAVEMYDGDGRRLKNGQSNPVDYELRSSVLGGQIVTYLFYRCKGRGISLLRAHWISARSPTGLTVHSLIGVHRHRTFSRRRPLIDLVPCGIVSNKVCVPDCVGRPSESCCDCVFRIHKSWNFASYYYASSVCRFGSLDY